jgi:hypothetical protein
MRRPSPIEVGQFACVALVVVAVFMLLPLAWAMLTTGLAGAILLTALERARVTLAVSGEIIESTATETDGA